MGMVAPPTIHGCYRPFPSLSSFPTGTVHPSGEHSVGLSGHCDGKGPCQRGTLAAVRKRMRVAFEPPHQSPAPGGMRLYASQRPSGQREAHDVLDPIHHHLGTLQNYLSAFFAYSGRFHSATQPFRQHLSARWRVGGKAVSRMHPPEQSGAARKSRVAKDR